MILKPFFCYYGGKWRTAKHYPHPQYNKIIEPFAGGAGYSLHHFQNKVILCDKDPIISELWKYLINVSEKDILSLPSNVSNVDDFQISIESKWLIGFWLNKGSVSPRKSASIWAKSGLRPNSFWGDVIKNRIADQLKYIRHWEVLNKSYEDLQNIEATWFVDPPYEGKSGNLYRCKIKDFKELGQWCSSRIGQVIVCEKEGANWLPFENFRTIKSTPGVNGKSYCKEVIWKNYKKEKLCQIY